MADNVRPESLKRIETEEAANAFISEQIVKIKEQVKYGKVLLALSGGVDSSVVAALLIKAIGRNLVCVHVNHGLLRKGEPEQVVKVFKHEETGVGELFGYFSLFLKIFGLSLWISLFVWLWSLLCFIPGIIAGLRYSQAFFILAENPEKGIRQCVNESKVLMSGRLWEFFVLQLSFIPWLILTSITCGIAGLYVTPYTTITYAGYYLSLKPPVESHRSYADGQDSEQ